MSYFSGTLGDTLKLLGWTQRVYSEKTEIAPPQINRYIKGVDRVPPENLARLLAPIPAEHRATLLAAYLRDLIPPEYLEEVSVTPRAASLRVAESPPTLLMPGIDSELDRILRIYSDLGMRHPEVRTMLKSYLVALRLLPGDDDRK